MGDMQKGKPQTASQSGLEADCSGAQAGSGFSAAPGVGRKMGGQFWRFWTATYLIVRRRRAADVIYCYVRIPPIWKARMEVLSCYRATTSGYGPAPKPALELPTHVANAHLSRSTYHRHLWPSRLTQQSEYPSSTSHGSMLDALARTGNSR